MIASLKPVPLRFWQSDQGRDVVRDWLIALPPEDKRVIGRDISTVPFGWPIGLPVCRPLGGGLWDVRSSLPSKREARVIFCFMKARFLRFTPSSRKHRKRPLMI
jgi:Phage derived protein Gp49-like (DUF891)